jgi:hypothetical protein
MDGSLRRLVLHFRQRFAVYLNHFRATAPLPRLFWRK